ncbi:cannabinoid receptor 2 [Onychostoma macrolepis]|uniref:cannabinoid receptor 2 n=1 Tax=Onychostoma macrolepis TaxID=369639 RepID=UPI00272C19B2|nr:cannabinoid receptor 2 [Onychostoma macrolepis]
MCLYYVYVFFLSSQRAGFDATTDHTTEQGRSTIHNRFIQISITKMMNISCKSIYMVLNSTEKMAIGTICLMIAPLSLLVNVLVLVVIACSRNLRRHPSYLFMGSLALADTIACCCFTINFLDFHLSKSDDSFQKTEYLLKLGGVTMAFTGSVGSLLVMAADRYHAIYKASTYKVLLTRKRALVGIVTLWVVAALISFLPLMGWSCQTCLSCSHLFPYVDRYYLAFFTSLVLVVIVLILVAYALIVWLAHKHEANMSAEHPEVARMRVDIHLAKTFGCVILILLVCWLPVLSFMMTDVVTTELSNPQKRAFAFCSTLCLLNSGINPLLYTLRCRELRVVLKSLVHGLRRC